jgi:formylmethanofuran:tetrahydromethanopterin formyltransferase
VIRQFSPDAVYYLSLLLAPAGTGEAISKEEYLTQVELVYSMIKGVDAKALRAEIAASVVNITITLPGTVQSVKGGTYSGREARFNIPLTDILVLEKALDYEITWQ